MARYSPRRGSSTTTRRALRALSFLLLFLFWALSFVSLPREAYAQRPLITGTGNKGQLVIDQVSGFRAGLAGIGGVTYPTVEYYGPIGFAIQSYSEAAPPPTNGNQVTHATTFWLAPSFDYFVIEHWSIGGLLELASTSGSVDVPLNAGVSQSHDLPTLTSFTLLPRVGYMFAIGDRWGIWPRGGLGFVTKSLNTNVNNAANNNGNTKDSFNGLVVDIDCSVLFRFNETFFARLAPEIGFVPAGSHSTTPPGGASTSADANYLQFTITGGIGVLIDL